MQEYQLHFTELLDGKLHMYMLLFFDERRESLCTWLSSYGYFIADQVNGDTFFSLLDECVHRICNYLSGEACHVTTQNSSNPDRTSVKCSQQDFSQWKSKKLAPSFYTPSVPLFCSKPLVVLCTEEQ